MKIAFVGLGNMGIQMAQRLVNAGHELTVWNRTLSKAEPLKAKATIAKTPAEAAKQAEVVITMLADDHAASSAVLRKEGVAETLAKGATHISMSTISVALSRQLAEEHAHRGQNYFAAPVFGRPDAAEAGKLFIVVSGEAQVLERYRPVLEVMGQRVFVLGDKPEMANLVKLSGNFLIASVIESLGEAVALARKYSIDPHAYIDFLTNASFSAPIYKVYGGLIADEKYQPAGFQLRLGLKDIRLALAAAEAMDVPLPMASMIRDHMLTAISRGMDKMDWSATAKLAADNAGLP